VRPPGHHAGKEKPCGFCLINNVALAAAYAKKKYGIGRVLVVDFDLHNGNGTTEIFYEDPDVVVFDVHDETNVYKERDEETDVGSGVGEGTTVNVPLKNGSGHASAVGVCELLRLCAAKLRPELVLVSAGFDGHVDDPFNTVLGSGLCFTEETYELFGDTLTSIAEEHSSNKLLYVLEGGYNTDALARSFKALVHGCSKRGKPCFLGGPGDGRDRCGRPNPDSSDSPDVAASCLPGKETEGDVRSRGVLARVRQRLMSYPATG
jgi:acetoin utilization deacetylase AcuC-like enzyme